MILRRLSLKHRALIAGAALVIPALTMAQSQSRNQGYLVDQNYNVVTSAGKTQPVTRPADCQGLPRKKLIACLQPDRRVDIETRAQKLSGVDSAHRVSGSLCELIKQHERVASAALAGVTKTAATVQLLSCS